MKEKITLDMSKPEDRKSMLDSLVRGLRFWVGGDEVLYFCGSEVGWRGKAWNVYEGGYWVPATKGLEVERELTDTYTVSVSIIKNGSFPQPKYLSSFGTIENICDSVSRFIKEAK